MLRGRLAGIGTLVDRHQPHQAHQPLHPLAVDRVVLRVQPCRHPPRAVERPGQVLPVDQRHQLQVRVADRRRATIDRGPADVQEPALTGHRQGGMRAVDHRAARGPAYLPSLLAKKSFSTLSWPICRYNSPTCASPPLSSRTPPASKTTAAPSSNIFFQLWIWFGCTSYSSASSAIVRSPLSAATATFALNEALCFFRVCFTSCSFSSAGYRNGTLITPPVSFPGTSSATTSAIPRYRGCGHERHHPAPHRRHPAHASVLSARHPARSVRWLLARAGVRADRPARTPPPCQLRYR